MANKEEGNLEKKMDFGKCNPRSRPYYFRRCKYKCFSSTTNIESLPEEMVSRILLELDAEEIYESAMLVCRRWYKIILTHNFIQEHLKHSIPGLLIQDWTTSEDPTFVTLSRGGKVNNFKFKFKSKYRLNLNSKYWATFNGLALEDYPSKGNLHTTVFVVNDTTNKRIAVPLFSAHQHVCHYFSCLGYAPASKEYKVVHIHSYTGSNNLRIQGCAILTLGVGKSWRCIDTQHIPATAVHLLAYRPLITEGFVHWGGWFSTCFLSLNLESEIFTETPIPHDIYIDRIVYNYYFSTWRSVTLINATRRGFSWDIWEMKKPGEWKKVLKIDLDAQKCKIEKHWGCTLLNGLIPAGWLNYMDVFVLSVWEVRDKALVLYDVRTREIECLDLDCIGNLSVYCLHRNSLVWLDHTWMDSASKSN
ncbi:hypothetical protein ABFS82_01G004300 [Erythranthe guttata]